MIHTQERAHEINGVSGRMFAATSRDNEADGAFCSQKWISESRPIAGYGKGAVMNVTLRFDDECRNGHNTFAMTAEVKRPGSRDIEAGGMMHDEIAEVFPELAPLAKWHLTSTDAPMHYIANAVYLAGDRDHWGLRNGERVPLRSRDGEILWELVAVTGGPQGLGVKVSDTPTGREYTGAETVPLFILQTRHKGDEPPATPVLRWVQQERVGEGKERELDAARRVAVWPEATDEELSQEPEALRAALEARLPELQSAFKEAMTNAGFMWERKN